MHSYSVLTFVFLSSAYFFIMLEDFCGKQFGILLWEGRGREGDGELLCFVFILFTVLSTIKL